MPAATSIIQHEEIMQRRKQGSSFASIAREMGLAYNTVRNIYRHYQKQARGAPIMKSVVVWVYAKIKPFMKRLLG